MKVEYKKDLHHNYMVISEMDAVHEEAYCIKLQKHIQLEGLLLMERRVIDNQVSHYYDISGKQSVANLYARGDLTYDNVKNLFCKIITALEKGYEYLLREDDFILTPEHIFVDMTTNSPYLCYLSGYRKPIKTQISGFIEYIMNKVDYSDKEAVLKVYEMYAISKEEHFTIEHLLGILEKSDNDKVLKTDSSQPINKESSQKDQKDNFDRKRFPRERIRQEEQIEEEKRFHAEGPFMMETLVGEKEVSFYPIKTYLYTGLCGLGTLILLILGVVSKLLYNSFGNRIDYSKLFGLLLLLIIVDGYLLQKIWDKRMCITKLITKKEYIDPLAEAEKTSSKPHIEESIDRKEAAFDFLDSKSEEEDIEVENPTCILNYFSKESSLILKPFEDYKGIYKDNTAIIKSPFYVGKLKKNVDLFLDQEGISRYHAKLTSDNNGYYLTDLNSTNGTFLNGIELLPYETKEIKKGDELGFAHIKFLCQ